MKWLIALMLVFGIAKAHNNVHFIKNEGQVSSDILYYAQMQGCNIFLKSDGFYYDFYKEFDKTDNEILRKGHVIKLDFENSNYFKVNSDVAVTKYNFIQGKNKENWIKNVSSSNEIILENIYDEINLKMYFDNEIPRYDIIVGENADPSQIEFNFKNLENMTIENDIIKGKLNAGDFFSNNLYAYQLVDGQKVKVDCKFVESNGKIKFEIGKYDTNKELIIDPIVYSSYMGWNGDDYITQIRTLDDNKYIVGGVTNSPDFPVTEGAYQTVVGFKNDIFLARYNRQGVSHIMEVATFYGGAEDDILNKMKIGVDKNIYIGGVTNSIDLPMQNSLKAEHAGGQDGFICVFNPDLNDIEYSYYVGGADDDGINDIELMNEKVFFCGYSKSPGLKLTSPFQNALKGEKDGIIGASRSGGSSIEFLTFIGGGNNDEVNGIDIDSQEYIYWIATSNSGDWVTYPRGGWMNRNSAYDRTYNGNNDMIIGRFTEGAGLLQLCSYFGGTANDYGVDVVANDGKNYYFLGYSEEEETKTIETKAGLIQEQNAGGIDMVFGRLSDKIQRSGGGGLGSFFETQDLEISTFIGDKADDIPLEITESPDKLSFLITGHTTSSRFPQINNEITKLKHGGKTDGLVIEINNFGTDISYSTFIGGAGDDDVRSGDYFPNGSFIFGGKTNSNNLFTTGFDVITTRNNIDALIGSTVKGIFNLNGPSGGEKYCPNNPLSAVWTKDGFAEGKGFNVYLLNEKLGIRQKLVDTTKGNLYNWIVSEDVVPDSSYKILVEHTSGIYGVSKGTFVINQTPKINSFDSDLDKVCIGDSVVLTASIDGVFKPVFNWKFNGNIVSTSNTGTLTLRDLTIESTGKYSLELKGECNPNAMSEDIDIDVAPNNEVTAQTSDLKVNQNELLELSVTAIGGELEYQWFLNDGELSGQNSSTLKIEQAQKADEGSYHCQINGRCGETINSEPINVTVETSSSVQNQGNFNKFYFDGNNLNAEIKLNYSGNSIIRIIDMQGKVVYNSDQYISQGTNKLVVPCDFQNGTYLFSLIANDTVSTYKFVMVK